MKGPWFNPCTIFSCKNSLHTSLESYWAGWAVECLKRSCLHSPQPPTSSYWGRNLKSVLLKGHHTLMGEGGSRFKSSWELSAPHKWIFLPMLQALLGPNLSESGIHHSPPEFKHLRGGNTPCPQEYGKDCCAFWKTCGETWTCLCLRHSDLHYAFNIFHALDLQSLRYVWSCAQIVTGSSPWAHPEVSTNIFLLSYHVLSCLAARWSSVSPEVKWLHFLSFFTCIYR